MQVRVPENDRGALRFLWWPGSDISLEPVEFQMNAHVFGAKSSPFCANFALQQTEVKRILTNRPIVAPRSDVRDKLALSPNMLLLLEENTGLPSHCSYAEKFTRKWKHLDYLADVFWKRWMKEYPPTLQVRQKWLLKTRNLKEVDVVLVVSDGVRREKWPLGIVTSCEFSSDGTVQPVSVKTATGTIRRDIRSLCLLEGAE
ncbi:hypothetical protein X801_02244 [Opisthorchis viverrini]|uniref:DUF5641 domain-containing protein n=1 Tax=Opisthorchis viverrini TaxID=6198 RepID=A0A1S8X5B8_OPIVI|nr:hypothetical protein X801_02244 [Opisthorchis viverrini]